MSDDNSHLQVPLLEAKVTLDKLISKQRVHLYKPIQIAEILYHTRNKELTINDLQNSQLYRNTSKKWRDEITKRLLGQVSTSSQKFQDNLFEENAIPARIIGILGVENNMYDGVVERYIYQQFRERQKRVLSL